MLTLFSEALIWYNQTMSDEELQRLRRIAAAAPTQENLARLGLAYLRSSAESHTLKLVGRRWTSRTYGNTYHTVDVYLDGELIAESERQYGYGDGYIQTGIELALANSDLPPLQEYPNGGYEAVWQWAERNNIKTEYHVTDVARQRDL